MKVKKEPRVEPLLSSSESEDGGCPVTHKTIKYVPVIGHVVRLNFDGEVALVLGSVCLVLVAFHYHTHHIPGCDVFDNEMPLTIHKPVEALGLTSVSGSLLHHQPW